MPTKTSSETALKRIRDRCNFIIKTCNEMRFISKTDKELILDSTLEFIEYFENAVKSSNPFMQNVNAMRAQGLWLPDKITDNSVREVYFKVAKGKALKIINNSGIKTAIQTLDKNKVQAIYHTLNDVNKYLDDLIDGKIIIE